MSAVFDSLINYAPKSFLDEKEQARACQRILASVVHLAIKDACNRPPTNKRGRSVGDMDTDAFTAMRFLFDDRCSGLKEYATWLDFDSSQFRRKLLKTMEDNTAVMIGTITPEDRRAFRFNYKTWVTTKDFAREEADVSDDD
jgi:hypothetical protein